MPPRKNQILLEPGNPLSLRKQKLEPLIQQMLIAEPSYDISIGFNDKRGYVVTWWQSLYVWVPWTVITTAAAKKLTEILIHWARHRLKGEAESRHPRLVV